MHCSVRVSGVGLALSITASCWVAASCSRSGNIPPELGAIDSGGGSSGSGSSGAGSSSGSGGGSSSSSGGHRPPPTIDPKCTTDDVNGLLLMGHVIAPALSDFVPLCSGLVLVGDKSGKAVTVIDVGGASATQTSPLQSPPGALALDPASGFAYAAMPDVPSLARVDVVGSKVTPITLTAPALGLAPGSGGRLFVTLDNKANPAGRSVAFVDGPAGSVDGVFTGNDYGPLIVANTTAGEVVVGEEGLSPSGLTRMTVDDAARTLTVAENISGGTNGHTLAISQDSRHLAFACGGGNAAGYTVTDFDPHALATTYGDWNTGAYPTDAQFSPDSSLVVATNGTDVFVFDVMTHNQVTKVTPQLANCSAQVWRVGFSRGGKIFYALADCSTQTKQSTVVYYFVLH